MLTPSTPTHDQPRRRAELRLARIRCAPSDLVLVKVTQWTADSQHGPLPLLLVCLTVVTGLVDAFSYLRLGHVFVANMTGNVVFLGFALAGVGEISIVASLLAIVAFALGAVLGGRWAAGRALHRGHLLAAATAVQAGTVLVASVIASTAGVEGPTVRLTLIGLLALAMGGQNAVVRRLAVPDLTTTVLTLTVTGLVADTTAPSVRGRRLISVLAMLAGAQPSSGRHEVTFGRSMLDPRPRMTSARPSQARAGLAPTAAVTDCFDLAWCDQHGEALSGY